MRKFGFPLLSLLLSSVSLMAQDEVKILPSVTKLDSKKATGGNVSTESKSIAYTVDVTGSSFSEMKDITVKYNIFYEVVELGEKGDPEVKMTSGSHVIASLPANRSVQFKTVPVKLEKASLDPGWYYSSGASSKARDKVLGVWFKAFDASGKQVGEYINPGTIAKKQKWKD